MQNLRPAGGGGHVGTRWSSLMKLAGEASGAWWWNCWYLSGLVAELVELKVKEPASRFSGAWWWNWWSSREEKELADGLGAAWGWRRWWTLRNWYWKS